jgi:hypothetical protein
MELMLWVVVVAALALAIGMAVLAWRLLRGDRQRTEARAAMLRRLATDPEAELEPRWQDAAMPPPVFATVGHARPPTGHWMTVVVVMLFVAIGAGTVYGLYPQGIVGSDGESVLSRLTSRRAEALPLELLSLSHRVVDGDFVVAGLIQNPRDGRPSPSVTAVVYVFDNKGDYFASGKAALEFATLAPGAESAFVVRLPETAGVRRFRVGFRATDGSVIAHVDRRGQPLDGTTAGAPSTTEGS